MEPVPPPVLPMPEPLLKIPKGSSFAFMPDGDHLLTVGASRAWMVSLVTGEVLFQFDRPKKFVGQIAISSDGTVAATASFGEVSFYNAQTGKRTHSLSHGDEASISGLEFVPGSHNILLSSWRILTAINQSTNGEFSFQPLRALELQPDNPTYYAVAFAASGDRFACFWIDHATHNISILNWPQGDEIQRLSWKRENRQPHRHNQVVFTPDGGSLLLTNPDGSVTLHSLADTRSGPTTIRLDRNATQAEIIRGLFITHLCFSPDGILLAYNQNSTLGLWEWPSGRCLGKWRISEPESFFCQVGFSKSGREIVASIRGRPSGIFVYRTADFISQN